ncbi:MAG: glycosyltransferase family 4 protein [Deltaproteobacteria bacterium]|nr:glycosyltransferase family 4 protein [Deltaproteobacteria bacterium]
MAPVASRPKTQQAVLKPLRICLLSYRSNPHCGGQGVYLKNLARALKDLGHEVDVVSGPPDPQLHGDIPLFRLASLDLYNPEDMFRIPSLKELSNPINFMEWAGISTMGFSEPFTFGVRAYYFLRDRFRNYDVVHDNQCLSYGLWGIKRLLPTVATIHHPITVDRDLAVKAAGSVWRKAQIMRWYSFIGMQKRVSRTLSHIITVSECARQDIRRDFNIPEKRFRVVPNGINTALFYPVPEIPREPNRLMVTNSADMPLKGLRHLMNAVADLSRTHDVRLTVVGEPRENGRIVQLIRELGIGDRITFTGRIDNDAFVRLYARASVAVVPSMYEGFGLPAGEAMACGVPVVSTTGGALPEVVGDAGVLVPPGDAAALSRAVRDLLDHPDRAQQMGRIGYRRVKAFFTWEKAAQGTVEAYRDAIHDHRRF